MAKMPIKEKWKYFGKMTLAIATVLGIVTVYQGCRTRTPEDPKSEQFIQRIKQETEETERKKKDLELEIQREIERQKKEQKAGINEGSISYDTNNLLSNYFFENSEYLTEEEIKSFLDKKNSCLKNTGIEKTITNVAKKYKINPLLILARTQVEQGLVSKTKATSKELKYATGYGAYDNGKWLPSEGLNSQLEKTAKCLRSLYDKFDGQELKIDYGKKTVKPKNGATHALLRYTPHTSGAILNSTILTQFTREIKEK